MDRRLIGLSRSMGKYAERDILTKFSLEKATIEQNQSGSDCLIIECFGIQYNDVTEKVAEFDPVSAFGLNLKMIGGGLTEIDRAKIELRRISAEMVLNYDLGKKPATVKDVSLDLILSVKNAGLLPHGLRLRCWTPYVYDSTNVTSVFLDSRKIDLSDEKDSRFQVLKAVGHHMEVTPYEGKFHDACEFSNLDILKAYARNLQQGIKK